MTFFKCYNCFFKSSYFYFFSSSNFSSSFFIYNINLSYVYFKNENKKALQGDKIETKEFILKNKIQIDYIHYISNQIMKPLLQIYALDLENIPEFKTRNPGKRRKKKQQEQEEEGRIVPKNALFTMLVFFAPPARRFEVH